MFNNARRKIQVVAVVLFWLSVCISAEFFLYYLFNGLYWKIYYILMYLFLMWIGTLLMYGFGIMVDNSSKILLSMQGVDNENIDNENKISNVKSLKESNNKNNTLEWQKSISNLSDLELLKRIESKNDWQDEYIMLCKKEIKKRNIKK